MLLENPEVEILDGIIEQDLLLENTQERGYYQISTGIRLSYSRAYCCAPGMDPLVLSTNEKVNSMN